ncbi:aspartate/glutamate racemase family protein [Salegentibacter sediminis]|uniref:aspartate/glutamate racemase family protein n=1 Tax=Salegentibacter sediminis TaxID=1930251 RepID=UPI0009BE342C|nr:amino acid racemase [Salegentibacter sediminis]
MKLLGMIGGTSWHSTIEYYRLLNQLAGERIGADQNPPLLLYSLNIKLMREQNLKAINSAYLEIAKKLEAAGAGAIIICANTPHMVYSYVQPKINIPILHIADAVGIEAQKKGYKRLGLLGNKPTMTKGFLQNRLKDIYKIEVIIPEDEYLDDCHGFVSKELTQGQFTDEARAFFLNQLENLQKKGADAIIMGCTELPILIPQDKTNIPLLETTDLHAQMAVDFIFEDEEF